MAAWSVVYGTGVKPTGMRVEPANSAQRQPSVGRFDSRKKPSRWLISAMCNGGSALPASRSMKLRLMPLWVMSMSPALSRSVLVWPTGM